MACETWRDKIEAYADGELTPAEMQAMGRHLPGCASCAADLLAQVQLKREVQSAGRRYSTSSELRQRVLREMPVREKPRRRWGWLQNAAAVVALVLVTVLIFRGWTSYREAQTFAELADLHVAALASSTPVDVVSSDRHTVKPWFQGKLPFTFNLPELTATPFVLEGGRMSYLGQAPGAQLIFRDGNHRISVFVFQDRPEFHAPPGDSRSLRVTFNVETWAAGGLRYFLISDVEAADVRKLSDLLKTAAGA